MTIFTETNRCIIREVLPEDADGFFDMDADPEVHRYLGNKPIQSREQAVELINLIRQQYLDNGIGRWAIIDKLTNEFIGWTGFKLIKETINDHINFYDLGYRLRKKYWGQGIATETGMASLKYGFETMKLDMVYAMTDCNNKGSDNVLQKLAFVPSGSFLLNDTPHNWYVLSKTDWKNKSHG
jgi:RimJ/RimL family protein N-acetyltransferase